VVDQLAGYLINAADPVPLVLDLRIVHDRVGSSTDPTLNGHLRYPNNLDQPLNDTSVDVPLRPRDILYSTQLKCGNLLTKAASSRINLNLDGSSIASKSHTHPSHSQDSRLFTSSLSLGVPHFIDS
jgi:hypothetical protein